MWAESTRGTAAEFLGTAALALVVVGSGASAQLLTPGSDTGQLAINAAATGLALIAIISVVAPLSGAQLNPLLSAHVALRKQISPATAALHVVSQIAGAFVGVVAANFMFGIGLVGPSTTERSSTQLWTSEAIASCLLVLIATAPRRDDAGPPGLSISAYVAAAYFFTPSTAFMNPALTIARSFTDSFTGISLSSAPAFVLAQFLGFAIALGLATTLFPTHVQEYP